MTEEGLKEANREFSRLEKMQSGSAEYTVSMTYLDWMTTIPWQLETKDNINIKKARAILDEDHYDLSKVKDRITSYNVCYTKLLRRGRLSGGGALAGVAAVLAGRAALRRAF